MNADPPSNEAADLSTVALMGTYAISGGLGALGQAMARQILRSGGHVMLTGRRAPADVSSEIDALYFESGIAPQSNRVMYYQADVTDVVALQSAFARVDNLQGAVLNAAVTYPGPFLRVRPEHIRETLRVNVEGSVLFAQIAAQHLLKHGGSIVAISSWASKRPADGNSMYGASSEGSRSLPGAEMAMG
jgi:NAD(P)-dependent dehydrogenase (short-subunit alcohol dehydrogenase family)